MFLLKLLIESVLIIIFVQDIRERSVYWVLFPVLLLLFLGLQLLGGNAWAEIGQKVFINIMFLVIQFLIVTAYFSLKNKRWLNITVGFLGWGDVLFLLTLCFYLSVLNFLFFYITSLILVLVIWLLWQALSNQSNKEVPLAGLQAIFFAALSGSCWWCWPVNLTNDDWLLQVIYK
jgi:hypothetical protein